MDLVTIGIIVFTILVAFVSVYFFKIATRETTFEEAYGQNALRLLTEEKAQKLKSKATKVKKNGKPADKEKHVKEVEHGTNVEEDDAAVEKTLLAPLQDNNVNDVEAGEAVNAGGKKNKKRNRVRKSENDVDSAPTEKEKVVEPENQTVNKQVTENVEETVKLVESKPVASAAQAKEAKPAAQQRQKKNVNNISVNDVLNYLKGLENVEPEYIAAVLCIKDQHAAKEAKLQDTIGNLKKEKADKENSSNQLLNELYNLQKDNVKLKSDLKLQQDKYETFEETVRNKLTETIQLKEENKRLSNAVAQGSRNATQYQQVVREAEVLRAEYTKKLSAVNEELNGNKQIIEKLQADNANIYRDAMSAKANYEKEFADLKHAGELLKAKDQELQAAQIHIVEASKEIDRASTACAELKKSHTYQLEQIEALKAQNETIHAEKNAIHSELSAWKTKCNVAEDQLQQVASGNDHFRNQLNELSVEIQELRSFKNKYAEVQNFSTELQTQKLDLTKKLETVQNQLSELEKKHKAETAKALKIEDHLKQLKAENEVLKSSALQETQQQQSVTPTSIHSSVNSKNGHHAAKDVVNYRHTKEETNANNGLSSKSNGNIAVTSVSPEPTDPEITVTTPPVSSSILVAAKLKPPIAKSSIAPATKLGDGDLILKEPNDYDKSTKCYKIEWPVTDWVYAPQSIMISSNWWNWSEHQAMKKSANSFVYYLEPSKYEPILKGADPGRFLFKFIVDDKWQCSSLFPSDIDTNGIENNYLEIDL